MWHAGKSSRIFYILGARQLVLLKISLPEMLIAVGNEHLKMSPFLVLNSFYIPKIHYWSCES